MRVKKKTVLFWLVVAFVAVSYFLYAEIAKAADSNTVSSTVIDKSVGTANAPGININQNDSCGTVTTIAIQSTNLGIATVKDINYLNY